MKKAIPYLLVIGLFIASCKKEHSATPAPNPTDTTLYDVTFNVSGLSQIIKTASKSKQAINSDNGIQNNVTVLYYFVRKISGNGTGLTLRQDTTSENFGTISERFAAGKYGIYIIGAQDGFSGSGSSAGSTYNGRWKDTFFKGDTITVSDTPVVKDLTLKRVVGQLEVNITDLVPANADNIVVTVKSDFNRWFWSAGLTDQSYGLVPFDVNDTTKIPAAAKGKIGLKIKPIILINTFEAFNVNITCYDAAKKILGSAIVTNLTCEKNTRTLLTGNLFNTNNSPSVILAPWNPTQVNVPF